MFFSFAHSENNPKSVMMRYLHNLTSADQVRSQKESGVVFATVPQSWPGSLADATPNTRPGRSMMPSMAESRPIRNRSSAYASKKAFESRIRAQAVKRKVGL